MAALFGGCVVLVAVAAGGLAWRLTAGPLHVTGLVRFALPQLRAGSVTVALDGTDLRIVGTALRLGEGGPAAARAAVTLEALPLLRGALRPRAIDLEGVSVHLVRGAGGALSVDGLPAAADGGAAPDPAILRALTHAAVRDATLTLTDSGSQTTGQLRDLAADLRQDRAGTLTGHAQATLSAGATASSVSLEVVRPAGAAPGHLRAAAAAVNPASLARLAPTLAPLAALDATLAVAAELEFTPSFGLQHASVHAESGHGRAFLPAKGGGTSPAAFAALMLDAEGDPRTLRLAGLRLVFAPPSGAAPTTVVLSGDASRDASHALAHFHVALDRAQLADLGTIWPAGVGGGARPWLVENAVSGAVHDGAFDLTFEAPAALDDVALTAAGGAMQAENVVLYWLRPVPPIEHAHVLLTINDPDSLTITATGAREATLVARETSMRIAGLSVKDQSGEIDTVIAGPIADVFTLLHHPRLKLLSVHPLPIPNPSGQSVTHLVVKMPLEDKLDFDSVDIHATAHLTDARVPGIVAHRDLDQGVFDADITQTGLTLAGTARLAGIGSALTVAMDFRAGPPTQVVQHVTFTAHGDDRKLASAGLDTIGLLGGTVSAKLDYSELRNGHAVLQGSADLREATLSTPLGWSKPAGPAASIEARAELSHGHLAGFDELRADGPGLSVRGHSEMVDGWPSILHVERCVIGRTSLAGTVTFPSRAGDALVVALVGPQIDLAGPLSSKTTFEPSTPDQAAPGRPYKVDLRFDRVLMSQGAGIGPVSLSASGDERRIAQAHFVSSGPEHVDARIEPQDAHGGAARGETRRVAATIGNFGLLLRGLGAGLEVDQGALTLEGEFDDRRAGSPLSGTVSLADFGVRGAAVFGKLLQGMTLYGLVDALRGPGLVFDQLTVPFTLLGSVVDLRDARAFSSSLGVTVEGQVDFGRSLLNLKGTIVPAYFFNSLLGRVPVIGALLSPETGGGVFAATFSARGKMADPAIGVNPLATLTPGALRGLFGLFD